MLPLMHGLVAQIQSVLRPDVERRGNPIRAAWDHLRANDLVQLHQLRNRIEQLHGIAPGAAILAEVLEAAGGDQLESEGERRLSPVASCFEPGFEPQVWVTPRRRPDRRR